MVYYFQGDTMKKEILKQYYELLCQGDYPSFIDRYLKAPELKRLKNIGQFCGCDYGIYSPLFFTLDMTIVLRLH